MKVNYSIVKGRASPYCITWVYRKKRHRKYFRSRLDALRFRNDKEQELGVAQREGIENELLFWLLGDVNDKLQSIDERIKKLEISATQQEECLKDMRKPPAPKILRVSEAAKVLRVSSRKLYYLLNKGVFKRYKLPHTRTTFIKLDEVEKALGTENVEDLLS
ncbi:helix-turn-helix domain-containing protein [Opitutales bacterium]|mgnify:FL=1|jgi:hypothetical protein|nr:helix-turn-helix domain-containing protein [Opitutales bacterium]